MPSLLPARRLLRRTALALALILEVALFLTLAGRDAVAQLITTTTGTTITGNVLPIGIGTTAPADTLDLGSRTDAMTLPVGSTGQRPSAPVSGMIRYNLTTPAVEAYYGNTWNALGSAASNYWTLSGSNLYPNSTSYNVGIGTTAPIAPLSVYAPDSTVNSTAYGIYEGGALSATDTSGTFYGAYIAPSFSATTTATTVYGAWINPTNTGSGTVNAMNGIRGITQNTSTGTVNAMYAVSATLENTATGTVGAMYGLYSRCDNVNAVGTVSTCYEAYLDTPEGSGSIGTTYGLYQTAPGALNYFAGNVGIGIGPASTAALDVMGPTSGEGENIDDNNSATGNVTLNLSQTSTGDTTLSFVKGAVRRWVMGTDSNDSYKFKIASTTGTYTFASSTLLTINGSGGSVGIGTQSPADRLDVSGAIGLTDTTSTLPAVGMYSPSANTLSLTTSSAAVLTITGSGNVGIGTTGPTVPLQISGSFNSNEGIILNSTLISTSTTGMYGSSFQPFLEPSAASLVNLYGVTFVPILSSSSAPITTEFAIYARLDSQASYSGTVTNGYEIAANGTPDWSGTTPITNLVNFFGNTIANGNGVTSGTISNYQLDLGGVSAAAGSGGTVKNYGIFVSQPSGNTSGTSDYGIYINGGGGASATNNYSFYNNSTANSYFAGSVGIGTQSPSYLLQVGSSSSTGVVAEFQNSAGACTFTPSASSMTPSCSSDARLKKDIADTGDVLAWLGDMRVRDFTIRSTGARQTGVVAQEMLESHPDMVHMGDDGFYTVDGPNPWKLVRAIQELEADNDNLRAATENLRAANDDEAAQIKVLSQRLATLEAVQH